MTTSSLGLRQTLREHWPEYLIEGWALGMFMVSASVAVVLLSASGSPFAALLPDPFWQRTVIGLAMGLTAVGLIYSKWGKQSGAHMNPAVTLTFMRLGLVRPLDGLFYILSQTVGGTLGVLVSYPLTAGALATPPVEWIVTVPGPAGPWVAFACECLLSFILMGVVLWMTNTPSLASFTGYAAGGLVAAFITLEAPYSGMSINPARSFASALPADIWTSFWIYLAAPPLGMLLAAQLYRRLKPRAPLASPKLCPNRETRCIHTGFDPAAQDGFVA